MTNKRGQLTDAVPAVGVAAVLALVVAADQAGDAGLGAYVWAVALGALMFWRRRYPRAVLGLTVLGLFAYYAAGYPAIGVAVPVAAALFSAAEAGHRSIATTTAISVLTVSVTFRLFDGQDFRYVVLYEAIGHVALMAAAIALGELVRARRRIDALMSRQVSLAADQRVSEHRQALSRELHDSIGHTMTVAAIHTNVARQEVRRDPDATATALDLVAASVSQALSALRTAVRDLRADPPPSVEDLEPFTDNVRAAGFTVRSHIEPVDEPEVSAAAFRLVREALTNAMRHSDGSVVRVDVRHLSGRLQVQVEDNGRSGHILRGLTSETPALRPASQKQRDELRHQGPHDSISEPRQHSHGSPNPDGQQHNHGPHEQSDDPGQHRQGPPEPDGQQHQHSHGPPEPDRQQHQHSHGPPHEPGNEPHQHDHGPREPHGGPRRSDRGPHASRTAMRQSGHGSFALEDTMRRNGHGSPVLEDEMRQSGHGSLAPTSEMPESGHGLLGLRDEIMALGGSLDAGPGRHGWLVSASLPLRGAGE